MNKRRLFLIDMMKKIQPLLLEGYSPTPGSDPKRQTLLDTKEKANHGDLVTVFDKKVEAAIIQEIKIAYPGEIIVGEEQCADEAKNPASLCRNLDRYWLIDPIDGTTNFSRAYPFFCSTVAYMEKHDDTHRCMAGVIFDPVANAMFSAAKDQGAWLNRDRLCVSSIDDPKKSLLVTGFAALRQGDAQKSFDRFARITEQTLGVRRDGSAALDLAYVAAGRLDGFWENGLSPWDIAAGGLLVEEAGGKLSAPDGSKWDPLSGKILSSNKRLHKWLVEQLII